VFTRPAQLDAVRVLFNFTWAIESGEIENMGAHGQQEAAWARDWNEDRHDRRHDHCALELLYFSQECIALEEAHPGFVWQNRSWTVINKQRYELYRDVP
jgi:hypothetical protein